MKTYNTACFTHMCGNCPCNDKNAIKLGIGTQLRTPKKGDVKRWKDFIIMLVTYHNHYATFIKENNLLSKFNITDKALTGRSTYNNYREHRQSESHKKSNKGLYEFKLLKEAYKIRQGRDMLKYFKEDPEFISVSRHYYNEQIKAYLDNEKRKAQGRKFIDIDTVLRQEDSTNKLIAIREQYIRNIPDIFRK